MRPADHRGVIGPFSHRQTGNPGLAVAAAGLSANGGCATVRDRGIRVVANEGVNGARQVREAPAAAPHAFRGGELGLRVPRGFATAPAEGRHTGASQFDAAEIAY